VVHRAAVVEDGGRAPQRIVGRGQQHFVAGVEQRAQRQVDQLADAVADEHAFGGGIRRAARTMEGGNRLARGGQALLMSVGIGAGDVVGDRALQVRRRAETEGARIADVELDQAASAGFQLAGAAGEFTADFVTDFGQAFAGLEAGHGLPCGSRGGAASLSDNRRPKNGQNPPMTALRDIGWPFDGEVTDPAWAAALAAHPGARPARVVEQHRSGYLVAEAPGEAVAVESLPEWQRPAGYRKGQASPEDRAAVGDWVLVEAGKIVALLPRHSAIKRGAAGEHYRQQLIAANIDTVFVVCGLDADFNPRRIERYLLLVQGSGAGAVVVLTKADKALAENPDAVADALHALADTAANGTAVVAVNAKDADTLRALAPWLQPGRSIVLVGSSGAGKSTLTNTLLGVERMKTGEVRESDSRGRHTTTHRANRSRG